MNTRLPSLAAAILPAMFSVSQAGMMSHLVEVQEYRDYAENRGKFKVGATNVDIYNKNGKYVGQIAQVMNFDCTADAHSGEATLAGSASFITTVAHDYSNHTITFTQRFGGVKGTAFYDEYKTINALNANASNPGDSNRDFRIQRLSKIVTEATAVDYLTDTNILRNIRNYDAVHIGSGTQTIAHSTTETTVIDGGYQYLTAGTIRYQYSQKHAGTGDPDVSDPYSYDFYTLTYWLQHPSEKSPLYKGCTDGDSGAPAFIYDPASGKWLLAALHQSSNGTKGYSRNNYHRMGNFWAVDMISSYDKRITTIDDGNNIIWDGTDSSGAGTISQGENTTSYTALAHGRRGDTSTAGTRASDSELDACLNLVFDGSGTILIKGPIDTGAGSLTFNGNYLLSNGGDSSGKLNSAGYIVNEDSVLTTTLTGSAGDEWRKIGDGVLVVAGSGDNHADINAGGNGTVILDRANGTAANNIKLNGGGVFVVMKRPDQIGGDIIFGHRGGVFDLHGNDLSAGHITHMDEGARLANLKADTVSTFTFTGEGKQTFLGGFVDGGTSDNGLLNIVYNPAHSADSQWILSGVNTNKGAWTINGGEIRVQGTLTLHAGGYVDEDDWETAVFDTGKVIVNSGKFTVDKHSTAYSDVEVNSGTFGLEGGVHMGDVSLSAEGHFVANLQNDETAVEAGVISGLGDLTKNGDGTLVLTADNLYQGTSTIHGGTIQIGKGGNSGSLGSGSIVNNGILAFNRSDDHQIANQIAGSGKLLQEGSGSVEVISKNTTYSGAVEIRNGKIVLGNDYALGTGEIRVCAGAELNLGTNANRLSGNTVCIEGEGLIAGNGTLGNNVLVMRGGIMSPGNSIGMMSFNSDLAFQSGAIFDWEVSYGGYDQLFLNGGNLDIESGTVLRITLLDMDYGSDYWQTNRVFDCIMSTQSLTDLNGLFSIDAGQAPLSEYGEWSIGYSESGNSLQLKWTSFHSIPEPSSFILLLTGMLGVLRRNPRA